MKRIRYFYLAVLGITAMGANPMYAEKISSFEFASKFYKIQLVGTAPFVKYFSVDAEGNHALTHNVIQWKEQIKKDEYELRKVSNSEVGIYKKGRNHKAEWVFKFHDRKFTMTSIYYQDNNGKDLGFIFDKHENHTTLLGVMTEKNKTLLPAVLHLPDMGTLQLIADKSGVKVDYDASRNEGTNFISVSLPKATESQQSVCYTFTSTSIYPGFPGVEKEKYSGYRRNYLNLFQVNPKLQVIANNSSSDPCAFTLFLSSMLALKTPPLVNSLTALDLLKMSIERYLNGMKGYGMEGYNSNWENTGKPDTEKRDTYLDTYPSLVISACNYIKGSKDKNWAKKYYPRIKEWMDSQMKRDRNNNGLVEYERSGNSGSWDGKMRPANWWDTIGYGHEDAFSNAITYDALNLIVIVAKMLDREDDAKLYNQYAEKLKNNYFSTFYNPKTGILAGWKSEDGKLHDYYFLVVNSMAVYYNLIPKDKIRGVMQVLWNKMQEVGYNDFTIGVPGNLVSIRREDYTHHWPRVGGGEKEDGSDAFQRYENGGASINWSYFTLKAFKKAGMADELRKITDGILMGINSGGFQGYCDKDGMTKDWKSWKGECWGYEGFLCDGYLVLLAFNPEDGE